MKHVQELLKKSGVTLISSEMELVAGGVVGVTAVGTALVLAGLAKYAAAGNGLCFNSAC